MQQDQALREVNQVIYYHIVFPTYHRFPILLDETIKLLVHNFIKDIAQLENVNVVTYNVLTDHVHLLIKKNSQQLLPYLIQLIKGRTTYYFFKQFPSFKIDIGKHRLWAKGYHYTVINNRKQFDATVHYIENNFDKSRVTERSVTQVTPQFTCVGYG